MRMLERLLPRHVEIIYEINDCSWRRSGGVPRRRWTGCAACRSSRRARTGGSGWRIWRWSARTAVNGVAELHSKLLAETTLRDFAELWPERFHNVTNGVTPRRFVRLANPGLADADHRRRSATRAWLTDLERLAGLEPLADDPAFRAAWRDVKRQQQGRPRPPSATRVSRSRRPAT